MLLQVYTKVDEHRLMLHQLAGDGDDEVGHRLRLRAHALSSELETLRPLLSPEVGPVSNPADKPQVKVLRLIRQVTASTHARPSLTGATGVRAHYGRARSRGRRPTPRAPSLRPSLRTCPWRSRPRSS